MQDTFKLLGKYEIIPPAQRTDLSGDPEIVAILDEELALTLKYAQVMQLTANGDTTVSLGGITNASLLIVKTDQPVTLKITTGLGAAQVIGVNKFLCLITTTVPITALTIARPTDVLTNARIVLGQA